MSKLKSLFQLACLIEFNWTSAMDNNFSLWFCLKGTLIEALCIAVMVLQKLLELVWQQ